MISAFKENTVLREVSQGFESVLGLSVSVCTSHLLTGGNSGGGREKTVFVCEPRRCDLEQT